MNSVELELTIIVIKIYFFYQVQKLIYIHKIIHGIICAPLQHFGSSNCVK